MTRRLLSVTTAIMLVFATSGKPVGVPAFIAEATAQSIDPALVANLENANAAVAAAEAALADAQAKGEGMEAAQQALEAAKAQQAAAQEQVNAAQAAQPETVPQEAPKQEAVEAPAEKPADTEQPQEQTQAPDAEPVEKPAAEAADVPDPAPEKPDAETAGDEASPESKPENPVAETPAEAEPEKEASTPETDAQPPQAKPEETAEQPVEKPAAEADAGTADERPKPDNPATDVTQKPEEKPQSDEKAAEAEDKPEGKPTAKPAVKEGEVAAEKPKADSDQAKEAEVAPPPSKEKPVEADVKENGVEEKKEEVAKDPQPSPDAPEAKELADAPIEKQIEAAEKKPAAVVPDEVTKAQQESLKAAEKVRRAEAKQKRAELIAAAAAGVAVGALLPVLGGKVVEDEGDRFVVERNGEYYVRRDESALFRDEGAEVFVEPLQGGRTRETITRPNGVRIVTLRDPGGYVLRRLKVLPNGDEITLFDTREEGAERFIDYDSTLPPLQVDIPQEQYIVSGGAHDRHYLSDVFLAPPVEPVETRYSLRNIRENNRIRSKVRRVDLDSITFDTGSATVRQSQVPYLADIAGSLLDVVGQNPQAVFLIEGHTDAVGSEIYNLTLSDRRAETVARILVDAYGVPPENLVVEGYGEQFLKIETQAAERQNRRVTIRNISPLLTTAAR